MITLIPIASGSSGNCMFAELGGHRILIDIGISYRAACTALSFSGLSLCDAEALLITHTHSDHINGLTTLQKKAKIPVFATGTTLKTLSLPVDGELPYLTPREILPGLSVTAFRTSHDCAGSAGFLLESSSGSLGYATDLGFMPEEAISLLSGADCIVIESNHDEEMLRYGPYPYPLKMRILSDNGHLSNAACADALRKLRETGTKHFLLAHLSGENNSPEKALSSAREALKGTAADVRVLPVSGSDRLILV